MEKQCVEVYITQSMDVSLIDGLRMNLVCTVLSDVEASIHWSGVGLKSMWVHQSSVSRQANKCRRRLSFKPWLDVHAGEYTCHVTMKNSHCRVEKNITVASMPCKCMYCHGFGTSVYQHKLLCTTVKFFRQIPRLSQLQELNRQTPVWFI